MKNNLMLITFLSLFIIHAGATNNLHIKGKARTIDALSVNGKSTLEVQKKTINISSLNKKNIKHEVLILIENKNKIFWWLDFGSRPKEISGFIIENHVDLMSFFHTKNKIVAMQLFGLSPSLLIRESSNRFKEEVNIETYEKIKIAIQNDAKNMVPIFKNIKLNEKLPPDFFRSEFQVSGKIESKITDIRFIDNKWQIDMEGVNDKNASIYLSADYDVISINILDKN